MPVIDRRQAGLLQGGFWALAGFWAIAWVWWAQHLEGMAPCALCLWERWPYRILIALGFVWSAMAALELRPARPIGILITLTLVAAIVIAGIHVGVEQGWWPSPLPECMAPHFSGGSFAERLASMPARPAKPCDSPNRLFQWLPVSMAMIDLLYAAFLLVVGQVMLPRLLGSSRRA